MPLTSCIFRQIGIIAAGHSCYLLWACTQGCSCNCTIRKLRLHPSDAAYRQMHFHICSNPGACAHQQIMSVQPVNEVLAHIPNADLDLDHYAFCSQHFAQEVIQQAGADAQKLLFQLLGTLALHQHAKGVHAQLSMTYKLTNSLPKRNSITVAQADQIMRSLALSSETR